MPIQIGSRQLRSAVSTTRWKLAKSEERRVGKVEMDVEMEEEGGGAGKKRRTKKKRLKRTGIIIINFDNFYKFQFY